MPVRRAVAWVVAAGLLVGPAGCRSRPPACVVTGVSIEEGPGPSALSVLGVGRDELRSIALEALAKTPGFEVPSGEPARGAPRCRCAISLEDAGLSRQGNVVKAEVLVRMEAVPGEDADALSDTVRAAESLVSGEAPVVAFRRAIRSAATRAASGLALALEEGRKPDDQVIRDLESADPRLRDLAVGVLADRKNVAAVPALVARLRDPDPEIADRAVGALAQIRDPSAVGPLIELARRREGEFVAQIVRAVGDIGGAEAEAYLETLAAGHGDPRVAEAARAGLQDAKRRRTAGKPGSGSR